MLKMLKLRLLVALPLLVAPLLVAQTRQLPSPRDSQYTIGPSVQPMIIVGEGWTQQFTFVNVSYYAAQPTVGTLSFYTQDGKPWKISLKNLGTVDHVAINLSSGQMLTIETVISAQPQQLGWASFDLSSNINQWGLYHAFTVYRKQMQGQPDLMTSVGFADGLEDEWIIPFDNTGGKYPGIALVNSNPVQTTTFSFQVFDTTGNAVKTFTKVVQPHCLAWFSLVGENPDLASLAGQIKVRGGFLSSAVFTLQFTPNGAFTALPIVQTYGM